MIVAIDPQSMCDQQSLTDVVIMKTVRRKIARITQVESGRGEGREPLHILFTMSVIFCIANKRYFVIFKHVFLIRR